MTVAALAIYLVGLAVVFEVRTWMQIRRTGSSGFNGISGKPGSRRWWAGVSFIAALVLELAALILAAAGAVAPMQGITALAAFGVVLALVGFVATLAAQTGMGASWRIGVKETERTELVTTGVFALVRNPIFTAMVLAQLGLTLMVPTWLSVIALVALVTAVELQVRLIEEPYLLATHGGDYQRYAARTGRFVLGIGRLQPTTEMDNVK
jgi:protein-S-isoprenylcysteine O-methyltransferase Ste14